MNETVTVDRNRRHSSHAREDVDARRVAGHTAVQQVCKQLRAREDRLVPIRLGELSPEHARVGGIASSIEHDLAATKQVPARIDLAPGRRKRAPLVVDQVAEGIARVSEAERARGLVFAQLAEGDDPAAIGRFVGGFDFLDALEGS